MAAAGAGGGVGAGPSGEPMDEVVLGELRALLFSRDLTEEDVARWFQQGFKFSDEEGTTFGLRQRSGGPCGVLAPIQANVLRRLLFGDAPEGPGKLPAAPAEALRPSPERRLVALVGAVAEMLWRAATKEGGSGRAATVTVAAAALPATPFTEARAFEVCWHTSRASVEMALAAAMPQLETACGVILVVYALLLSRGLERVRMDMDEQDSALVARFGHCSQEMLNLCATGMATTNVFDGMKEMVEGVDGLVMRGILEQPEIGYLSQLEALRYFEVGLFYKNPRFPVWIVGSQSHFTVLFSLDPSSNEPEPSSAARREFNKVRAEGRR